MTISKFPDYLIKRVRKNDNGLIICVELSRNHGINSTGIYKETRVVEIVKLLNKKYRIITIYKNAAGVFIAGSDIEVYNNRYIRSDANCTPKDNLDNLPTF